MANNIHEAILDFTQMLNEITESRDGIYEIGNELVETAASMVAWSHINSKTALENEPSPVPATYSILDRAKEVKKVVSSLHRVLADLGETIMELTATEKYLDNMKAKDQ